MKTLATRQDLFIVESTVSEGFFLQFDCLDDEPTFTKDLGIASHYGSEDVAQIGIDRVIEKGFTMNLEIKELEITYIVKGSSL